MAEHRIVNDMIVDCVLILTGIAMGFHWGMTFGLLMEKQCRRFSQWVIGKIDTLLKTNDV